MIINNVKILPFLQSLEKLSWINMTNAQNKRLSPEAFYLHNLGELVDIKGDYLSWLSDSPVSIFFSFQRSYSDYFRLIFLFIL